MSHNFDITIKSKLGDYPVEIRDNPSFLDDLSSLPNTALLLDRKVYDLYRDFWDTRFNASSIFQVDAIEENKSIEYAVNIYNWLIDNFTAKKNINFISAGGGIIQDISGFVASTLYRGIDWRFIPTTLLAQCDSCIGGKTSLNFKNHKNLLGTFYPPKGVYIWSGFTQTLSDLDKSSGYGEIIKFLLMEAFEKKDFSGIAERMEKIVSEKDFLSEAIQDCLNIKRSFMECDEFDRGRRNLLNYGHCFGHALESAANYYVPHGIAVNIGIIFANMVAVKRGMLSQELAQKITQTINLPYLIQSQRVKDYDGNELLKHLKNDKKRVGNQLALVIPNQDGLIRLNDFSEQEFFETLNKLKIILFK